MVSRSERSIALEPQSGSGCVPTPSVGTMKWCAMRTLPTIRYSLFTIHYSLSTNHSLLTAHPYLIPSKFLRDRQIMRRQRLVPTISLGCF